MYILLETILFESDKITVRDETLPKVFNIIIYPSIREHLLRWKTHTLIDPHT